MATVERYQRIDLLNRVLQDRVDWAPTSDTNFMAKVNRKLNDRIVGLSTEVPSHLFEQEVRAVWLPDYATGTIGISATDAYVWKLDKTAGTWSTTFWGGRYLEVVGTGGDDEDVRTYRILEIYEDASFWYAVTDRAHPNTTDVGMTYRIFSDGLYLPPEMKDPIAILPVNNQARWGPLSPIAVHDAEQAGFYDWRGEQTSTVPQFAYRGGTDHLLRDPMFTPTVTTTQDAWAGPTPTGTYKFIFTYILGQEEEAMNYPSPGSYHPLLESGPSPESATVVVTANELRISLPQIEWQTGYSGTTVAGQRFGYGGIKKRIYVAWTATSGAHSTSNRSQIEAPDIYFHLADVDGETLTYDWDGTVQPNYWLRLRAFNRRQIIKLFPRPDARLEFKVRGVMRVRPLLNDYDSVELPPEIIDPLCDAVASDVWNLLGNPSEAKRFEAMYLNKLGKMQSVNTVGPHTRMVKRIGRAGARGPAYERVPARFRGTT